MAFMIFCDLSLATMLALEQVSVINDLRDERDAGTEERQSDNSAVIQQSSSSSSRDTHNVYL